MPGPYERLVIGDDAHVAGDARCPECLEEYPAPCPCGGLMHAVAGDADEGGVEWPATRCDRCGRSEEELH